MRAFFLALLFFISIPIVGHAQILFSEIAWMGTDTDANNEWIELYNFSGTDTDVTGWVITFDDAPFISLTGSIPPHGVVVLERTDDNTLPGSAFQIYTGALPNTGGTLKVQDMTGAVNDEVVGGTNWSAIGGSNITVPKMTPQRTRTGTWITGLPTPGADNVQENVPIPQDDARDETVTETSKPKSNGGGGSSRKVKETAVVLPGVLSMTVIAPKTAYVNQTIEFEALPQGIGKTLMNSLVYSWNFGDTYVGNGKKISHVFSHPGEYIVVVEAVFAKQRVLIRHDITVLPTSFELSRTDTNDILLHNNAKYEVDIGGYVLQGDSQFTFPKFTYVKANGKLIVPKNRIGQETSVVSLLDTERTHVALLGIPANTQSLLLTQYGKSKPTMTVSGISTTQRTSAVKSIEPVSDATAVTETIEKPTDTIVRIGNTTNQIEKQGFFSSIFKKFVGIFN